MNTGVGEGKQEEDGGEGGGVSMFWHWLSFTTKKKVIQNLGSLGAMPSHT